MKTYLTILTTLFVLISFQKQATQKREQSTSITQYTQQHAEQTKTVIDKIAAAYGFENWPKVEKIEFSFVVNPGEKEMKRHWIWYPIENKVSLIKEDEKITYNRNYSVKEDFVKTDKAFVNDSFWLLFPFHLTWGIFNYEVIEDIRSPINQEICTKLIVKYTDDSGYTPGDRYDVYLDKNYHIIEWAYYPNGKDKPALINTFEDLTDFDGIKINMTHKNPNTGFQLNFRDIRIN